MLRKRLRKNIIKYSCILIGILGILFLVISIHKNYSTNEIEKNKLIKFSDCDRVKNANAPITPSSKLNDQNETQLVHALKNGLKKPFSTNAEFDARIDSFKNNYILVEVTETPYYQLKSLTHSKPYLIPEAVDMLNEIGYRFQSRLAEKKYNNFRFRITSMLRTEETQSNLSHRNYNASSHSAHLYGTTVDISYKNFYNIQKDTIESSFEAVQTLTKVLVEMRQECKLLVVREHKQSCFHITVVVCKPETEK